MESDGLWDDRDTLCLIYPKAFLSASVDDKGQFLHDGIRGNRLDSLLD